MRLRDHVNRLIDRINWRGPTKAQLWGEIERLGKLVEIVNSPELTDLELEPGGILRMGITPNLGSKVLAISFAEMILNAPNWSSVEVGPFDSFEGKLLVTVKRSEGDSPEATCRKLKELINKLVGFILAMQYQGALVPKEPNLTAWDQENIDANTRAIRIEQDDSPIEPDPLKFKNDLIEKLQADLEEAESDVEELNIKLGEAEAENKNVQLERDGLWAQQLELRERVRRKQDIAMGEFRRSEALTSDMAILGDIEKKMVGTIADQDAKIAEAQGIISDCVGGTWDLAHPAWYATGKYDDLIPIVKQRTEWLNRAKAFLNPTS